MKKAIFLTLVAFVIGLVIGSVWTVEHYGRSMASLVLLNQEVEIVESRDSAMDAYYNQSTEVAVWALENYISTLILQRKMGSRNLVAYADNSL